MMLVFSQADVHGFLTSTERNSRTVAVETVAFGERVRRRRFPQVLLHRSLGRPSGPDPGCGWEARKKAGRQGNTLSLPPSWCSFVEVLFSRCRFSEGTT